MFHVMSPCNTTSYQHYRGLRLDGAWAYGSAQIVQLLIQNPAQGTNDAITGQFFQSVSPILFDMVCAVFPIWPSILDYMAGSSNKPAF